MTDTIKIEIPKTFYDVLVQKASVLWPEDEQMEHYSDVVTTRTPDDSYG